MKDQAEIEQKQQLLEQHWRNLRYLEQQAAQYGLDLPLAVHNALTVEKDAIASLERELAAMGVSIQTHAEWQALLIDPDNHWRNIIAQNVSQMGGRVIEQCHVPTQITANEVKNSDVAILGVPEQMLNDPLTQQWIGDVVKLGRVLPIILLACWNSRDTAIALRQAVDAGPNSVMAITLFKDNFDPRWFSRVVHKMLIQ
jgi:hypothetical protein